jgi:hypothetical protein
MKKHPTGSSIPGFAFDINRVFKNKLQAVSQGVRRFGKRSLFSDR